MHTDLPDCGHTTLQDRCACCVAFQASWYVKLQLDGFEEAENTGIRGNPLKVPTGLSIQIAAPDGDETVDLIDLLVIQEPNAPLRGGFPESHLNNAERLLCHPEFDELCRQICAHGNHRLNAAQAKGIWLFYIEGKSVRTIACTLGVNYTAVWRTIKALTDWMELMDLDEMQEPQAPARVVIREFKRKQDEALVYATWRNSLWYDDDKRREGDSDRFFRVATGSIRDVLDNPNTVVRVACLHDCPDVIVGYSVVTGWLLHFVYVKADYRNKGIGTLLVPKNIRAISPAITKVGRIIALKKKLIKENPLYAKTEGFEEPA